MKSGILFTFLAGIIFLCFTQCDKNDDKITPIDPSCINKVNDTTEANSLIIGEWNWIQTYRIHKGTTEPEIQTPASNGSKVLVFNVDKTVEVREKNDEAVVYHYSIKKNNIDPSLYIYFVKPIDNSFDASILGLCSDTLIIDNSYDDSGGKELYIRK